MEVDKRYDVFISVRSEDLPYARRVQKFLEEHGILAFLSEMALRTSGSADYQKVVEAALQSAEHIVVVGSSRESFESPWVEAEWRIFIDEKRAGRKRGNVLSMLAGSMSVSQLPISLRSYQALHLDKRGLAKLLDYLTADARGNPTVIVLTDVSASMRTTERDMGAVRRAIDALSRAVTKPVLEGTRATPRGTFGFLAKRRRDEVDCTVFAPPEVGIGHAALLQVFAHSPSQKEKAEADAKEFDGGARRRGVTSLGSLVARGSKLTFELVLPLLDVDERVKELIWRGETDSVQFAIKAPKSLTPQAIIGNMLVSQDMVPIGGISFKLEVLQGAPVGLVPYGPSGKPRRYEQAFISYASEDRAEVLRRVQMLTAVGVKFFQDILSLEPGDQWLSKVYQWIDESDVFLLFWSSNAKESEWVKREWDYALRRGEDDFIRPVIIEGPPPVSPPPELAHLHFNDRALYFLDA